MYKVTEMNNDEIMWQLIRSELGFILLGEDGADAFSVLAKNGIWRDRPLISGSRYQITCSFFQSCISKIRSHTISAI